MAEHTVKSLGLQKVWIGTGPRDYAWRGHGYSIEPVTRRFWRLRYVGGDQIATAGNCTNLLAVLADRLKRATP